jgi:RND superfamily putative drug exporter
MNPLHRLGLATARHPWRTIAAWVIVLVALGAAATTWGGTPRDDWNVPGARAQTGIEQLRAHLPAAGGTVAQVVVHDRSALDPAVLDTTRAGLGALRHALPVDAPQISADGDTALFTVRYDVPATDPDVMGTLEPLEDATRTARDAGYRVEFGGELPGTATELAGRGELIGIGVALLLLVIAFGSVLAAGLPIAVALGGLVAGSSGIALLAGLTDVSTSAPTIATMVGLGVGIDYALLLVTRHVERLRAGLTPVQAAAVATATAGRSVVGAGLVVLVSLLGLRLAKLPTYDSFGFATGLTVLGVMVAAVTLVPALCALAGPRLLSRRSRRRAAGATVARPQVSAGITARVVAGVARRPVVWGLLALVTLLALAAPALGMRTWPQDGGSQPTSLTTRQAHDLIGAEYGPGANGTLTLVADRDRLGADEVTALHAQVDALSDVVASTPVVTSPDGRLAVWDVQPRTAPTETATTDLIDQLRDDVLPAGVEVTGGTALLADISTMLGERLWIVVGFVVAMSVLLLTVMFRSVVVPLKAAAMNLLSIGAAYGVMTLVFQHAWGSALLGVDHAVPVSSWVPILMFTVLFGLSMDYEVFLLSAVRESWLSTGDARGSVVAGVASTARVISMAAAIMVAVFLGFATEQELVVKMLGVGLAVAVGLDATLVRLVLVPATMTLLGRWNWWAPRLSRTPAPAAPTPAPAAAVASTEHELTGV